MQYLQEFIRSDFFMSQVTDTVSGTAYNALTIVKLNFMQFPLPPLAEQSRIVTRVAQLRRLCFELRQRLTASQSTQAHLAEALVETAVG
jgi:type I restriction enzyme S subunit